MPLKVSLKGVLFVAGIMGMISSSAATLFWAGQSLPPVSVAYTEPILFADNQVLAQSIQTVADINLPARLSILRIHLSLPIEHVGLTREGAMGVPKNFMNTAWFDLGPRPWEIGSAVIDGHFGYIKRKPGAFNNLHKLRKGDKVSILDEKGITITFVVRESHTYRQDEDVPDVFTSNDGKAHLNLITCHGIWNKSTKSYSERLVVFTDRSL